MDKKGRDRLYAEFISLRAWLILMVRPTLRSFPSGSVSILHPQMLNGTVCYASRAAVSAKALGYWNPAEGP